MSGSRIRHLHTGGAGYPTGLMACLGDETPGTVALMGNADIPQGRKLALFCSSRCPASLILKTHELVENLRRSALAFVSGFHSPVEQECLTLLLRSHRPLVYCLARALDGMRMRREYRQALEEGRLVFLSPFLERPRRATSGTALYRNRFAAALADATLVVHAEPFGKTEQLCREILAWGKPLFTLDSHHNENLIAMGAATVSPDGGGAKMDVILQGTAGQRGRGAPYA